MMVSQSGLRKVREHGSTAPRKSFKMEENILKIVVRLRKAYGLRPVRVKISWKGLIHCEPSMHTYAVRCGSLLNP